MEDTFAGATRPVQGALPFLHPSYARSLARRATEARLHHSAVLVLQALCTYADGAGHCYPGQARLARETGLCVRSVRNAVVALERVGLLARVVPTHAARAERTGATTSYALALERAESEHGQRDATEHGQRASALNAQAAATAAPVTLCAVPPVAEAPATEDEKHRQPLPVKIPEKENQNARTGAPTREAPAHERERAKVVRVAALDARHGTRAKRSAANRAEHAARTAELARQWTLPGASVPGASSAPLAAAPVRRASSPGPAPSPPRPAPVQLSFDDVLAALAMGSPGVAAVVKRCAALAGPRTVEPRETPNCDWSPVRHVSIGT